MQDEINEKAINLTVRIGNIQHMIRLLNRKEQNHLILEIAR